MLNISTVFLHTLAVAGTALGDPSVASEVLLSRNNVAAVHGLCNFVHTLKLEKLLRVHSRYVGYHSTLQVVGNPVQSSHVSFHHLTLHVEYKRNYISR